LYFYLIWIFFNWIFISISIFGGIILRLNCLRQIDLKSLIAYSSVVHIGIVLGAIFSFFNWGLLNCYLMIIAHGLCSSGLFCLANIVYERLGRRSLFINKGLICFMPRITLWWFLLCSRNISAPPSLNLLGEIGLINSLVNWSLFSIILLFFFLFLELVIVYICFLLDSMVVIIQDFLDFLLGWFVNLIYYFYIEFL